MFNPGTLKCLAAKSIIEKQIPTIEQELPFHLFEDLLNLNHIKKLREEEEYLSQKLEVLESNLDHIEDEEEFYDVMVQDGPLWDEEGFLELVSLRDHFRESIIKLNRWIEKTKQELDDRDVEEEFYLSRLCVQYQNIEFVSEDANHDVFDDDDVLLALYT